MFRLEISYSSLFTRGVAFGLTICHLTKKPIPEEGKFIMLNANTSSMGWIVYEVTDIVRIDDSELETMPQNINSTENNFVESIGKLGERLIIILNTETLSDQGILSTLPNIQTLSA